MAEAGARMPYYSRISRIQAHGTMRFDRFLPSPLLDVSRFSNANGSVVIQLHRRRL